LSPLALGVGLLFNRVMAVARPATSMRSWMLIPAIAFAGLLVGVCSVWWPELPGNGKSILTVTLNSGLALSAAVVILFLKPLLTAVFLRAGAVGGMLTPALATGAAMGSAVAIAINTWTTHAVSVPAVSLTCAASVLAITQRAPLWAAIFVWELARPPWWLLAPFLAAAVSAHGMRLLSERSRKDDASARPAPENK
jgi:H+/Cl- antiporter ClcA